MAHVLRSVMTRRMRADFGRQRCMPAFPLRQCLPAPVRGTPPPVLQSCGVFFRDPIPERTAASMFSASPNNPVFREPPEEGVRPSPHDYTPCPCRIHFLKFKTCYLLIFENFMYEFSSLQPFLLPTLKFMVSCFLFYTHPHFIITAAESPECYSCVCV